MKYLSVIIVIVFVSLGAHGCSGCGCYDVHFSCAPFTGTTIHASALEFVYPSPTPPCAKCPPTGIPLKDAVNVPLNIVITGSTVDVNGLTIGDDFTFSVYNKSGYVAGRMEISYDKSSLVFIPNDFLQANKTYILTASQTIPKKYETKISFSTVPSAGSMPTVIGTAYSLVIPKGSVTQPPGIGYLEPFLQGINIMLGTVDVVGTSTGQIQFAAGESNTTTTGIKAGGITLPLVGQFTGPYVKMSDPLNLNVSGVNLPVDSVNIRGTMKDDWTGAGTGVGITDVTLAAIATCATLPADIKTVVQQFCTATGYLVLLGSFFADPVLPSPVARDKNGDLFTAGSISAMAYDLFTTTGTLGCVTTGTNTVSVTVRDVAVESLVSGTTATHVTTAPGTCAGTGGQTIDTISFVPASPLTTGNIYRSIAIVDLTPLSWTTFIQP